LSGIGVAWYIAARPTGGSPARGQGGIAVRLMTGRLRPLVLVALVPMLSACFLPFPFDPFGFPSGETQLHVENATDENWVLRVSSDGFPTDFAVGAGQSGVARLFGSPGAVSLLDPECEERDTLTRDGALAAVRINADGTLSTADPPPGASSDSLVEFFECANGFGFGGAPAPAEPLLGAGGTIHVIGADGSVAFLDVAAAQLEVVRTAEAGLTGFVGEHVVSPDGSRIAMTTFDEAGFTSSITIVTLDSGDELTIAENATTPTWSPDGSRIAYLDLDPFRGGAVLTVADADGSERAVLAENASMPQWSPDGSTIAYIVSDLDGFTDAEPPPSELWVVDVDGSDARKLGETAPFPSPPAWSPGGDRIAIVTGGLVANAIGVVELETDAVTEVAEIDGASLTEPAWSPGGERLAFTISTASLFGSDGSIGLVEAGGGEIERRGEMGGAYYGTPTWSPDGRWLVAARSTDATFTSDLVAFDTDGAGETVLATDIQAIIDWRD
jgi:WD40-like Beta Propeller Repeat